jgi:RNA polymerase sigma factor (sigma-70 family)
MPYGPLTRVIHQLRRIALNRDEAELSDGKLLEDFVARRDEAAFGALLERHGPMVMGVCQRVVHDRHDAEDAFQATFLVLVRKAGSVARRELLANWLYGVAYRTALKARTASARRKAKEAEASLMARPEPADESTWRELQPHLDQALTALPDRYRQPIVLCMLEGKTKKEAALLLGCPEGTVSGRLARAKELLAKRLARYAIGATSASIAAVLAQAEVSASVTPTLTNSTMQAATALAAGQALTSGLIPTNVAFLVEGVTKSMLLHKVKMSAVLLLAVSALGFGAMVAYSRVPADVPVNAPVAAAEPDSNAGLGGGGVPAPAVVDKNWATVKGQIVFAGAIPAPRQINVNKNQAQCLANGPIPDESWVINKKNRGVRWTFAWLAPEPGAAALPIHPDLKAVPKEPAVIDQPCCSFIPHCVGMREGQELHVLNTSPIPHNVNVQGNPRKNPGFNVLIPSGGNYVAKELKADKYPLSVACNIHPWMSARVAVFSHPYFAVTDENGTFEIKNAPVGNYRLIVWHESVGWRGGAAGKDGEKITIKPGGIDLGQLKISAE